MIPEVDLSLSVSKQATFRPIFFIVTVKYSLALCCLI